MSPGLKPKNEIRIFTDGASSGNPGPSGWAAILSWPDGNVLEIGGYEARATNNRMELLSCAEALERVVDSGVHAPILVFSDSTYVIKGATQWSARWEAAGWPEDLANRELWKRLRALHLKLRPQWQYVPGHAGVPGNERADEIAVGFSKEKNVSLYDGPVSGYEFDLQATASATAPTDAAKPKGKPFYLSLMNGKLARYSTWSECEAQVKGRPGARFKKIESPDEEAETLARWGFKP